MRKYTVIESNHGEMPSAGYATEVVKMVSELDGWCSISFLKEFMEKEDRIEEEDGELFFVLNYNSDFLYSGLNYEIYDTEEEFIDGIRTFEKDGDVLRCFRFFNVDYDFGIEELQML